MLSLWADTDVDYLGFERWVSAVFTATTPLFSGDYTFETLAWTDSVGYMFGDTGDPEKVDLKTAESFAILAASAITLAGDSNDTEVFGDIGLSPVTGANITGFLSKNVDGTIYTVNDVGPDGSVVDPDRLTTAMADLQAAYDDAKGRQDAIVIDVELGGQTLTPGVYTSTAGDTGTFDLTGTLFLDAEGNPNNAFIFQMGSTLTTATDSNIVLVGETTFCQVFWQVGTSATLGTRSTFVGHVLAHTSITAHAGAKIEGQLLALDGAVTLDGSNTITNDPCTANVNRPGGDYDGTLVVTIGNGNGTETGTGTGDESGNGDESSNSTEAGTETSNGTADVDGTTGTALMGSGTAGDSASVSGGTAALPETGGLALAQVFYALGGMMMIVGGIMLKRKYN